MKRSGAMFLVNREGKVLLVHPSGWHNRNAPWMPPKEEIEEGETPLDAARRAVVEELHLKPDAYESVIDVGEITYKSKAKVVGCYAATYLGRDDNVVLDWENDRYGWFTTDEAMEIVKEEFRPAIARVSKRSP